MSLKEQRTRLSEDQREALLREVEGLKAMAHEAAGAASAQARGYEARLDEGIAVAVRRAREEEARLREELQGRLEAAEGAKLRLEDDILGKVTPKRRRRGKGPATPLALAADADGDPLGLTDLYSRLAAAEDDLRASRHANQKLKVLLSRVHAKVTAKTPLFRQKQLELEGALVQLDEAQECLDYARREAREARADRKDLEAQLGAAEKEDAFVAPIQGALRLCRRRPADGVH